MRPRSRVGKIAAAHVNIQSVKAIENKGEDRIARQDGHLVMDMPVDVDDQPSSMGMKYASKLVHSNAHFQVYAST